MLPKRAFLCRKATKEIFSTIVHAAVLHNHVPGPVFLRRISASWRLAHPLRGRGLLFRNCIKLDGHSVFKSGSISGDIPEKQKKDHDIIRPITENVPCGRSYRNPSNIINIHAFLNVRMQCNIREAESQCSTGDGTQSLRCVHVLRLSGAPVDCNYIYMI